MPRNTTPTGATVYVPGAYSTTKVASSLPGPLPQFHVPVLLGGAHEGHPYNADSLLYPEEAPTGPFRGLGSASAAKAYFGAGCDIGIGMGFAKKHGLPFAYVASLSALTRASVPVTSTGPIVQYTLYAKKFGAPAGHTKVKIASGTTITVTPVKQYAMLTANAASGATRLYVKDSTWVRVGQTLYLGANDQADTSFVVRAVGTEPTTTGQIRHYVDLTTATAAAFNTAQYAMILEWDETRTESSGVMADAQAQIDWLNSSMSTHVGAHKEAATFSNPAAVIALATSTPLKEIAAWGVVVKGASPAPASSDYSTWITLMDASAWDEFVQAYGVIPQTFCALEDSSTIHGALRDWAIAKRLEGFPISVTVGTAWGDTVISSGTDTSPTFRAAALNSQDVMLCAGGLDQRSAALSLSPAIWALRIAGGLGHNLTNDRLLYSSIETPWDERNSGELTSLCRGGVASYRLSVSGVPGFVVMQGLSTLQNNSEAWNTTTEDTPLVMQRDLADFVDRVMVSDLDGRQVGADRVTPATISAVMIRRAEKSLIARGYITAFRISGVTLNENGVGYDVIWGVTLPVTGDFLNLTTYIEIGE